MTRWRLYWVKSDGYEDCFVVAKNSRSAKSVEKYMNGFDDSDLSSFQVAEIPDVLEKKAVRMYKIWSKKHAPQQVNNPNLHPWPGYAEEWLIKDMGAQFRTIDGEDQTLLRDIVFGKTPTGEWYTYIIGPRAISLRNKNLPKYDNYENEPRIDITDMLHTAMGLALTQCHEIEYLFSKSFIFCVSENLKKKYETFNDFFVCWEKKTLGGLFSAIQESFNIDEDIKRSLELFLSMRNTLVHGITQKERYNINTDWGQRELISFLDLFLSLSILIKDIAASCFEMSIKLANDYLLDDSDKKIPIKSSDDLLGLFAECFKIKNYEHN